MPSRSNITTLPGKTVQKTAKIPLDQVAPTVPPAPDQGVVLPMPDVNHVAKQHSPTSHRLTPEEVILFVPGRCINPALIEDESGS